MIFGSQVGKRVESLTDQHLDVLARMVLHHQEGDGTIHAELIDLDHVGVMQLLPHLQFVFQVADLFLARSHFRLQVLDGHPLLIANRFPHLAGCPRSNEPHHAIGTKKLATTTHRSAFNTVSTIGTPGLRPAGPTDLLQRSVQSTRSPPGAKGLAACPGVDAGSDGSTVCTPLVSGSDSGSARRAHAADGSSLRDGIDR